MKKIAIAGASVALAAMPILGVFATTENTVTDTLRITVENACAITATMNSTTGWTNQTDSSDKTTDDLQNYNFQYAANITNGANAEIVGTTMKVTCNDHGGWYINAAGKNSSTVLDAQGTGTDIATAAESGTNYSTGATSAWGFKMSTTQTSGDFAPTIVDSYGVGYVAVPSSATKVVTGPTTDQTTGSTVTSNYKVYISPTQEADTYVGGVTYTLIHPNAA